MERPLRRLTRAALVGATTVVCGSNATAAEYRATDVWWQAEARVTETGGGALVFQLPAVHADGRVAGTLALLCPRASPRGPFLQIPTSLLPAPISNAGPHGQLLLGVNNRIIPAYLDGDRFLIYLWEPQSAALRSALLESKTRIAFGTSPDAEAVRRGELDGRRQPRMQVDATGTAGVALRLDVSEQKDVVGKEIFTRFRAAGARGVTIADALRSCDAAAKGSK
jgi:hypothetical protein